MQSVIIYSALSMALKRVISATITNLLNPLPYHLFPCLLEIPTHQIKPPHYSVSLLFVCQGNKPKQNSFNGKAVSVVEMFTYCIGGKKKKNKHAGESHAKHTEVTLLGTPSAVM